MSDRFDVQHNGMDLYRKGDWDTNNTCATMDHEWTRKDVQTLVRERPVEALKDFQQKDGFVGLQDECDDMVVNIHVAHLVALNAMAGSAAENDPETKGALQLWIRENWTPLFDQIRTQRVNWQEQIDRLDGFTLAGTEAALEFFDALAPELTQ